jgi:hypothetical protein
MVYNPYYVDLIDIPVQVPDDYSDAQKYQALEVAEGSAELDLNEGEHFDNSIPSSIMDKIETAVKQKATAELVEGAESPNDVTLGDISDDGSSKKDYADIFDSQYEDIIMKIRNSGVLDSDEDKSPYVYTTSGGDSRVEGGNVLGDSGGGSYFGRY